MKPAAPRGLELAVAGAPLVVITSCPSAHPVSVRRLLCGDALIFGVGEALGRGPGEGARETGMQSFEAASDSE